MKYDEMNKPIVCYQTQNKCYKGTREMKPLGVLWHSTAANNPNIARYVQPSDNAKDREEMLKIIGVNKYKNDWNHTDRLAGMNAFIGKLADGTVATVQTMPWNYRPWGCGSGSKGSCNDTHVQFEICESDLSDEKYTWEVYNEAVQFTAYICKMYGIDPHGTVDYKGIKVPTILCHQDSAKLGLGNNHSDVLHWFPKTIGKTMEDVRNDVAAVLATESPAKLIGSVADGSPASIKAIWDKLYAAIGNPYGTAGLMGNLQAESSFKSNNLQNTYESKLGYTDDSYTKAVDDDSYDNFVHDSAGYGLAQWTYWSRKEGLLNYTKSAGKSISDWESQVEFLLKELAASTALYSALKNAKSVEEASTEVLLKFECPADQSETMKAKRASFGQAIYDTYAATLIVAKKGDKSNTVKEIQQALLNKNYDLGKWGADGSFGSATEAAVKKFQTANNLAVTGTVNRATYDLLFAAPTLYTITMKDVTKEEIAKIQAVLPAKTIYVDIKS